MRRILALLVLLWAIPALGMDTPVIGGGSGVPSNTATNYMSLAGSRGNANATESNVRNVIPIAGTLKDLRLSLGVAPSAGKNWAFTVFKNGSATGVTCSIADAATTCSDTSNTLSLAAGDTISLRSVPTGTPTVLNFIRFAWTFQGGTQESIILGNTRAATLSNAATNYGQIQGSTGFGTTENLRSSPAPTGGILSDLRVDLSAAPGAGTSYAFTVMKNGSADVLTCTVSNTGTTCADTSNTVSVSAGDLLSLRFAPSGAAGAPLARWGMKFAPTTDGESIHMNANSANLNTAGAARYSWIGGATDNWQSGENAAQIIGQAFTLRKLFVALSGAPGAGTSYTFRSRKAAANGNLVVTVSDAATTGSDTSNSDTVAAFDLIDVSSLSAGSPAARAGAYSVVAYVAPAGPTPTPTLTPTLTPTHTPTPIPTPTDTPAVTGQLLPCTGVGR